MVIISSRQLAMQYYCRAVSAATPSLFFRFHSRGAVVSSKKALRRDNYSCLLQNNNIKNHNVHCSSGSGRGNNPNKVFQQPRQGILLNIALFSSALYGAAASSNSTLCSTNNANNNNNDGDDDFISKIKAKIDSQVITLSPQAQQHLSSILTTLGTQTQLAINSGIPTNLSYGFFAGYISGFALKKIGRIASITFGIGFVILQTLAYHGYVDVNHTKLARQVEEILDRNGDGVVDGEDVKSVVEELKRVVGFGILNETEKEGEGDDDDGIKAKAIAGGGGFGLGFWGGLRSG
ncbi:hypothetical protein ACHAXM_011551 [Skeletonema potamos]|jgi:uncharacterized membrane protein (Fun14 family)